MNFKRILAYTYAFCFATLLSFLVVMLFFGIVIGILMFITWSFPISSPFTWVFFRIAIVPSILLALSYCFSANCKQYVDNFEKGNQ